MIANYRIAPLLLALYVTPLFRWYKESRVERTWSDSKGSRRPEALNSSWLFNLFLFVYPSFLPQLFCPFSSLVIHPSLFLLIGSLPFFISLFFDLQSNPIQQANATTKKIVLLDLNFHDCAEKNSSTSKKLPTNCVIIKELKNKKFV